MRSVIVSRATNGGSVNEKPAVRRAVSRLRPVFMACLFSVGFFGCHVAVAGEYILGPQDKLRIRVFEWRPVTGTAYEWVPLNGEFAISAAGSLSLPIIGVVPAAGLTVNQISDSIGERLKEQVGMQKRPNASVEVSEYRPFFITGLVTKPGKFDFSPGLTVIQALSMAGGMEGPADANLLGLQRDVLAARGDLRTLNIERFGLLARQARIDAVVNDFPSIKFPPELTTHSGTAVIDRMMKEEEDLFETRQRSINAEVASLNEARVLATNQIDALKSKAASLAKQIDLASKDLGTVNKLVSAGLTVSTRSLSANQYLGDLESRNLDVALANLKAQQDVAKVDRDITDARNKYRVDSLTEAADIRERLAANIEKTQTTRALIDNIAQQAPIAINNTTDDSQRSFQTTIDRLVDGTTRTIAVGDNDPVEPGDVIRVEKLPDAEFTSGQKDVSAAARPGAKQDAF